MIAKEAAKHVHTAIFKYFLQFIIASISPFLIYKL